MTETERADRAEALADEILGSFKQERLRAERAEAEVKRLKTLHPYMQELMAETALADRLAEALRHIEEQRSTCHACASEALAEWEEARRES